MNIKSKQINEEFSKKLENEYNKGPFIRIADLSELDVKIRWYEKIIYKLKNIYDFFRYDIPFGFKNLIKFFKVIWKFRTWDFAYDLEIYKRILELRLKDNEKFDIHTDKSEVQKLLKDLINEIDKIQDDEVDFENLSEKFKNYNILWW